jgi:hypothetical protein
MTLPLYHPCSPIILFEGSGGTAIPTIYLLKHNRRSHRGVQREESNIGSTGLKNKKRNEKNKLEAAT